MLRPQGMLKENIDIVLAKHSLARRQAFDDAASEVCDNLPVSIELARGYSCKTLDKSSCRVDIHGRCWENQALAWIFMEDVG